jgi:pantetheine-phosphate adenylyltransferase
VTRLCGARAASKIYEGEDAEVADRPVVAVYPGTFDPMTAGHHNILQRSLNLFDHVVILIAESAEKPHRTPLSDRLRQVRESVTGLYSNVTVASWSGLTSDYVGRFESVVLVRGVRNRKDLRAEWSLASMNEYLSNVPTVLLAATPQLRTVSSTHVRESSKRH